MTTNTLNNATMSRSGSDSLLDQLFASARSDSTHDLGLDDDNFTKLVINSLPAKPSRTRAKRYYPDLIGLVLGLVATLLVINPTQIINSALSLLPSNISISLTSMLMASLAFSCLAYIAWWSVERSQSRW
ncbi:MAG: hypothetical protein ACI9LY_000149 [Arenicella sp.]|jgi:hypothetical protein